MLWFLLYNNVNQLQAYIQVYSSHPLPPKRITLFKKEVLFKVYVPNQVQDADNIKIRKGETRLQETPKVVSEKSSLRGRVIARLGL